MNLPIYCRFFRWCYQLFLVILRQMSFLLLFIIFNLLTAQFNKMIVELCVIFSFLTLYEVIKKLSFVRRRKVVKKRVKSPSLPPIPENDEDLTISENDETSEPTKDLCFVRRSPLAKIPTRATDHSAGYDLYSIDNVIIKPQGKALIPIGLMIALPEGTYGRIAPRSGLAVKHFIDVGAGVIDADYRGVISVLLFNHGKSSYKVKRGERVAQLICEKIQKINLVEVDELDLTMRNENGFGSSGYS